MNEVLKQIEERRSVRKYKSDMIPDDIIEQIVKAGTFAASAKNIQSTIVVAITNKEIRDKLSKVNAQINGTNNDPFYGAPVVLIVLADRSWKNRVYDGSLVMGNLMLAAHSLGIGSCWIHRAKEEFDLPEWKEWLKSIGVQGDYEGIGHCILGYTDGEYPVAAARKDNRVYYVK